MKTKKVSMYEIREYLSNAHRSGHLGKKLRSRKSAHKILKRLKKSGRDVFIVKLSVTVNKDFQFKH